MKHSLLAFGNTLPILGKWLKRKQRELEELRIERRQLLRVYRVVNRRHLNNLPLPDEELRLHVGTRSTEANFLSQGANSSELVLQTFGRAPTGPILDWGCGSGRTWRWLQFFEGWRQNYFGCDVDTQAIAWLRGIGLENVRTCGDDVPLPFPDMFFQGLYAFSVLTHIHPSKHRAWYQEIHRVLKPGGKALLTTQGCRIAGEVTTPRSIQEQFNQDGNVYLPSPGHYKDAALVSEEYTRRMLEGFFDSVEYRVSGYQNMDVILVQRPLENG